MMYIEMLMAIIAYGFMFGMITLAGLVVITAVWNPGEYKGIYRLCNIIFMMEDEGF